ncbi:MAG TPA: hypothetical protein VI011_24210, partial [Asanoa sp.]
RSLAPGWIADGAQAVDPATQPVLVADRELGEAGTRGLVHLGAKDRQGRAPVAARFPEPRRSRIYLCELPGLGDDQSKISEAMRT